MKSRIRPTHRSIGLHLLLIVASMIALAPVLFVVANSFTPESEILRRIDVGAPPIESLASLVDKATPSAYIDNFQTVLSRSDGIFLTWFRNSVQVALATTMIAVFFSATAAYAFSRFRFPGHRSALRSLLIIQMFPGIVLIVPLFNILRSLNVRAVFLLPTVILGIGALLVFVRRLYHRAWHDAIGFGVGGAIGGVIGLALGGGFWIAFLVVGAGLLIVRKVSIEQALGEWSDTVKAGLLAFLGFGLVTYMLSSAPTSLRLLDSPWGLVLANSSVAVPFSIYMLKAYFDTIPYSLEEAGRVDGLSHFGAFWRITIPLSIPGLAVTGFFTFITAWNEFMYAFTFNLSSENFTLPPGLQTLVSQFRTEWGLFSAGSVLVSIPVLIFFFIAQRYLVSGLTAGGLKQ